MAVYLKDWRSGMTLALKKEMRDSGKGLKLLLHPDQEDRQAQHGGVRRQNSMIVAPIASRLRRNRANDHGRALGHTGGTLDKLESIRDSTRGRRRRKALAILKATGAVI
jgi:pyrimidine-nucleoside phosphorylase